MKSNGLAAGIIDCGKQIVKDEGAKSLWKGLTPFATHLTLKYALRMGTNAFYQSLLRDQVRAKLETSPVQMTVVAGWFDMADALPFL